MHLVDETLIKGLITASFGFHFEVTIRANVRVSAALCRTKELGVTDPISGTTYGTIFPQIRYKNLTIKTGFLIDGVTLSSHADAGRHAQAYQWMKEQAIAAGLIFDGRNNGFALRPDSIFWFHFCGDFHTCSVW